MLTQYLAEISRIPRITAAEEIALGKRIRKGDAEAVNELARANLRLVAKYAFKMFNGKCPVADLVQEGNVGLMRAARKFDPARNCKFSTLAVWWIRQAIRKYRKEKSGIISIPVYVTDSEASAKTYRRSLKKKTTKAAYDDKRDAARIAAGIVSLDHPLDPGQRRPLFSQLPSPENKPLDFDQLATLFIALGKLDDRAQTVIRLRFGLADGGPLTLDQISQMISMTRERMRQIQNEALETLRKLLTERYPK